MPRGKEKVVQYNGPAKAAPIYTERLKAGTWFGFAEVGGEIPKKLRLKFEEMPSFFITKQIPEKPVPQHKKDYAAANDRKKKGRRKKAGGSHYSRATHNRLSWSKALLAEVFTLLSDRGYEKLIETWCSDEG